MFSSFSAIQNWKSNAFNQILMLQMRKQTSRRLSGLPYVTEVAGAESIPELKQLLLRSLMISKSNKHASIFSY